MGELDPEADTDKLMMGTSPLTKERLKEIIGHISRAQTYRKAVELPTDDVLSMIAEIRMSRRLARRDRSR